MHPDGSAENSGTGYGGSGSVTASVCVCVEGGMDVHTLSALEDDLHLIEHASKLFSLTVLEETACDDTEGGLTPLTLETPLGLSSFIM